MKSDVRAILYHQNPLLLLDRHFHAPFFFLLLLHWLAKRPNMSRPRPSWGTRKRDGRFTMRSFQTRDEVIKRKNPKQQQAKIKNHLSSYQQRALINNSRKADNNGAPTPRTENWKIWKQQKMPWRCKIERRATPKGHLTFTRHARFPLLLRRDYQSFPPPPV